jgi:hypothetical protein
MTAAPKKGGAMRKAVARMIMVGIVLTTMSGLLSGGAADAAGACNNIASLGEVCYSVQTEHGGPNVQVILYQGGGKYTFVEAERDSSGTYLGAVSGQDFGNSTGALLYCDHYYGSYRVVYLANAPAAGAQYVNTGLDC